ncbi:MAG: glycerate kinase [Elusimicrobia bacterium]|nr:glycerate kinase [Elusimicrobiota bacterium]
MKILIAPNAFKSTLGPLQAARAIARAVGSRVPAAELKVLPVSDGGDGLLEAVLFQEGGRLITSKIPGPVLKPVRARWLLAGRCAVIEMAEAAGLKYLKEEERDPLNAATFGVGRLIRAAASRGAHEITVGLGGSASNDGGAGCAAGFGFKLLDAAGNPVPRGAGGLGRLQRIIPPPGMAAFKKVKMTGLTDVANPLCGRLGSARVYGPQKGASPAEVAIIEKALLHYSAVVKRELGVEIKTMKGGAAAGGLGAGLAAFFGARLCPGAAAMLERLGFEEAAKKTDLVITGEGRLDETSFYGKAPVAIARLAGKQKKPVVLVCGSCAVKDKNRLRESGILEVIALDELFSLKSLFARPALMLERGVGREIAKILKFGQQQFRKPSE